jgi:serine phosphatase RsbU (regulator of sigma subunit)
MPAALVMATTRSMLRAVAMQLSISPGQALAHVNELLCPDLPASMLVICFYGILDPATGYLHFANAGQDLPCLRRAEGTVGELCTTGMPFGMMPDMRYEERDVTLAPGECVLFYSDGIVEAHNPAREMFGFPRLRALLASNAAGEMPPSRG